MILAVDFDGTLVEHAYPNIGAEVDHVLCAPARRTA